MKKQVIFFAMTALAAIVFVSCSMDDETVSDERIAVKFAADGSTDVQTRVSGDSWERGDPVGIYMTEHRSTNVSEGYANISYTASGYGTGAVGFIEAGTKIYYPQNGNAVDFIAYHPYQAGLNDADWTYRVNVGDQNSLTAIDLMRSEIAGNNSAGYDKTYTGDVNLRFRHRLAKLNVTVQAGAGVGNLYGLTVTIKGMKTKADFNVKTDVLSNERDPYYITPKQTGSYKYESILLPTSLNGNHEVVFTVGGNEYTWELSGQYGINGGRLAEGTMYDYVVTLNKHAVSVTGTITNWSSVNGRGNAVIR
ncbi:MAG: fimbrillin family protein [Tannerella sp.]|jgi:endonuclease G|nr:fimbrillin family protein [Tannerella sp.]